MVVISKTMLVEFSKEHPDVTAALNDWWEKARTADWDTFLAIKRTFNSVDYVGNDRYVFNIKGNKYRLVAMIFFNKRTIYICFIGSHSEYDKINCSTI